MTYWLGVDWFIGGSSLNECTVVVVLDLAGLVPARALAPRAAG